MQHGKSVARGLGLNVADYVRVCACNSRRVVAVLATATYVETDITTARITLGDGFDSVDIH